MMRRRNVWIKICSVVSIALSVNWPAWSQEPGTAPVRPSAPIFLRPYLPTFVPPVRLLNSTRVHDLIRAGILYLTAQDAIALALENNIDLEVARYNPSIAAWQLERAEAGGLLPGVPSSAAQASSVAAGQGVAGSQAAAGVTSTGANANTGATTNASITSVTAVGTNLVVHGTNNNVPNTGFHYVVLTSTNIALPLGSWTAVATNSFNTNGTFDYTNPVVTTTPRLFIDVKAAP